MPRFRLVAASIAVAVLTASPGLLEARQAGGRRGAATTPPRDAAAGGTKTTAVISGRVTAIDSGRPLRRAQVRVSSPDMRETRSASTGTNGRFEIRDLLPGAYTVFVTRSGYQRLGYGQKRPGDPQRRLDVAEGQVVADLDFALPRMSVISGRVFDEGGEPIAGVSVTALQMRFFEGTRKLVPLGGIAATDDTGQYRLLGLDPGDYYILATSRETWETDGVSRETLGFAPTYFPSATAPAAAQRVKVVSGQEAAATDIALVPGRTVQIRGSALRSNGTPLAGQTVNLSQSVRSPTGFIAVLGTDGAKVAADGTFTLRNVTPGEYTIRVGAPATGEAPGESAVVTVSVGGTDLDGVTLTTVARAQLSGRIAFDADVGPSITPSQLRVTTRPVTSGFTAGNAGGADNGRVREDWTFTVAGVFGLNRISLATLPPGWAVKSIEHNGRDVADSALGFTGTGKFDDVIITLTDRFPTLSGNTFDGRAMPTDAMVIVFADDASKWGEESRLVRAVRSDTTGAFRMRAMPPGDYLAIAVDYVVDGDWHDPQYLETLREGAIRVTLREGEAPQISLRVVTRS